MFVWPPKSHPKLDFRKSPVWPFTGTHMQMQKKQDRFLFTALAHFEDFPTPWPRAQSSEREADSMCSESSKPNKQPVFGEGFGHKGLVLTKKTCTSAKYSLFSLLTGPLEITNIMGMSRRA